MWAKGFVQKHCSLWLSGSSQVLVVCFFPCFVQTCSHKLFSYFHTHDIPCLPVAGLCRGSAPRDAWHRTQVSIPEPNAFTNPKPMATSLHAIQKKILPTHPWVKDFTHVRPNSPETFGFTAGQLGFAAFVVGPVKLIHDRMLNGPEGFFQRLAALHIVLKMASVIVDQGICMDFWEGHGGLHCVHFVSTGFIHNVLLGSHHPTTLWINDKLPAGSAVGFGDPLPVFVGTGACSLILPIFLGSWPTSWSNGSWLFTPFWVQTPVDSEVAIETQDLHFWRRMKCERLWAELLIAWWVVDWEWNSLIRSTFWESISFQSLE